MERVIIVGGGLAGLTAGIYLAKQGVPSLILEKTASVGGNLTGWHRQGFTVDNCIHWLTGTREGTALYRLWEEIGALGEGKPVYRPPFLYRSEGDRGEEITFSRHPDRTREEMLALSPVDRAPVDRFFSAVGEIYEGILSGKLFRRPESFLRVAALCPETLSHFSARMQHPLLRAAMTDYIGGDFSAAALAFVLAHFAADNADIPSGGSLAMAEGVKSTYLRLGGEIRVNTPVSEILLSGGRALGVRTKGGELLLSPAVIAACDPAVTFGGLTNLPLPHRLLRHYRRRDAFPIFSSFHAAFRVKRDTLPLSGTVTFPVRPFLIDGGERHRLTVRAYSHEPTFSPGGESLLQCMLFLHEPSCREWIALRHKDRERYRRKKETLADTLRMRIGERYPVLSEDISTLDTWTPATYHRYFGGIYGSYMSFALTGKAIPLSASPRTAGEGLFLATQWATPPGGLPCAARAGRAAAEETLSFLRRARPLVSLNTKGFLYKNSAK